MGASSWLDIHRDQELAPMGRSYLGSNAFQKARYGWPEALDIDQEGIVALG